VAAQGCRDEPPDRHCRVRVPHRPRRDDPVWEDISAYAMGLSITRGRQYELDTIQASTLTLA
jgi:hypothetical protein